MRLTRQELRRALCRVSAPASEANRPQRSSPNLLCPTSWGALPREQPRSCCPTSLSTLLSSPLSTTLSTALASQLRSGSTMSCHLVGSKRRRCTIRLSSQLSSQLGYQLQSSLLTLMSGRLCSQQRSRCST